MVHGMSAPPSPDLPSPEWNPGPTSPSLAPAQDALGRVTAMVAVASGLAASGRRVDLAGLEDAAGRLCAMVLDLPPRQGLALRDPLMDLRRKLDALAAVLRPSS